ncbi:MAG TPA: hypothetical protein DEG78_02650 [Rhodobacteraceae bacterium]|nr:hypothetical protein [Paracoccaceae bacterium]HCC96598.1 hypothetical protein [Paracoccaceae bacterium]
MQRWIKYLARVQRFDPTQLAAVSSARCHRAALGKGKAELTSIIVNRKEPCGEMVQAHFKGLIRFIKHHGRL